jgi:hypothetical protein
MANRQVKIYNSPDIQNPGHILGFQGAITGAYEDPQLHSWLQERGYTTLSQSDTLTLLKAGGAAIQAAKQSGEELSFKKGFVPVPAESSSWSHMLIEPPLNEVDLRALSEKMGGFPYCDSANHEGFFIDQRVAIPSTGNLLENPDRGKILSRW